MKILRKISFLLATAILFGSFASKAQSQIENKNKMFSPLVGRHRGGSAMMQIKIISSAFKEGEMTQRYTCDGANISPPLKWSAPPEGTRSLALICDDPDAPMGTWVHWVIYNIPPEVKELSENVPATKTLKNGALQGITDFGRVGYGGPAPPSGAHRYYFKLYALDIVVGLGPGATKKELLKAIENHILASGQLMGRYKRQK